MIIGGKHVLLFHFENGKDELEGLAPKVYWKDYIYDVFHNAQGE